ncbi:MAG TPA: hypothetical protein PK224_19560 [Nitrospira sp.]|nr:hypothetical protein [Nitrospira sp.]
MIKMANAEFASIENDALVRIERNADDLAGLLKGLESTAHILHILGMADNPLSIETPDLALMMRSFEEQLATIRDGVEGLSDMASEARTSKLSKVKAVR